MIPLVGSNVFRKKDKKKYMRFQFNSLSYTLQQCFLYCALFPRGYEIERDELIEYLIAEGIIEAESRRVAFQNGHSMLNALEEVNMLESVEYGNVKCFKMHCLLHDMAVEIMRKTRVIAEAEIPDCTKWTEDLVRVSIIDNDIEEISSEHSPKCPNLVTLLLRGTRLMSTIADSFFEHLSGLKVLDFSGSGIHELPSSISHLVSLNALLLPDCELLSHVPSLANLKALKKLDLLRCYGIEQVPQGIEFLCNLRYLDLRWTRIKELPAGIIQNFPHLQILMLQISIVVKAEELIHLTKLETLVCSFSDISEFNAFTLNTPSSALYKYTLLVGEAYLHKQSNTRSVYFNKCYQGESALFLPNGLVSLDFHHCNFQRNNVCLNNVSDQPKFFDIFACDGIQYLDFIHSYPSIYHTIEKLYVAFSNDLFMFSSLSTLGSCTFSQLKEFEMTRCARVKNVFPVDLIPNLKNLEKLQVCECESIEEIITAEEGQEEASNGRIIVLPRMKSLKLRKLPELKSIWNGKIECRRVKEIQVIECAKLKRMALSLVELTDNGQLSWLPFLEQIKVYPKQWWESVELEHPSVKNIVSPLCYFVEMQ